MKYCPSCKQKKEIKDFAKNRKRYDGVQSCCRSCKAIRDRNYYTVNKKVHRERVKKYLIKNKRKLWEYLENHPCKDCGEKNPVVLEFDLIKNDKKEAVSFLINYSKCSWETLLKEIEKCEIRCANCHRIKTAKQRGWYQFLGP